MIRPRGDVLFENNSNDNSDSVANSPTSSHSECNTPSIDAIEKEKFDPSLPTAFKMSKLFEIAIEELFFYKV